MTCRAVWLSLLVLLLLPLLLMMVMLRGLWLVVAALLMLRLVMVIMLLLLMVLPAAPLVIALVIAMLLTPIAPPATLRPTSASASASCWLPSLQAHLISTPRAQRTARRVDRAFITAIHYCARGSCNNITVPIPSSCAQGGSPRIRGAIKRGDRRGTVQINAAPLAAL